MMPVTAFIFEYFIFNSLYQVNWARSIDEGQVLYHERPHAQPQNDETDQTEVQGVSEMGQQRAFIKFVLERVGEKTELYDAAFAPLSWLPDAKGDWTQITSSERLSQEEADRFFQWVAEAQQQLVSSGMATQSSRGGRRKLCSAARVVYLVRNNIFHGSKRLGDVYNGAQRRRIELYEAFVRSLNSLFFLSMGHETVGSMKTTLSVYVPLQGEDMVFGVADQYKVGLLNQQGRGYYGKDEDRWLIPTVHRYFGVPTERPRPRSALFYPSAGGDLVPALLMGMPYCSTFYFYDRSLYRNRQNVERLVKRAIQAFKGRVKGEWMWTAEGHGRVVFECLAVSWTIHLRAEDNEAFLEEDVDLAMYVHRGDSMGEGGSGQRWDSDWLPRLATKMAEGAPACVVTDGEPGGLAVEYLAGAKPASMRDQVPSRTYVMGYLDRMPSSRD